MHKKKYTKDDDFLLEHYSSTLTSCTIGKAKLLKQNMQELKFLKQKYLGLVAHIFHFKVNMLTEMRL